MSDLVGTRWHDLGGAGAPAGGIVTVERVEDDVAYGRRETGEPWAEGLTFLTGGKFYAAVPSFQRSLDRDTHAPTEPASELDRKDQT